MKLSKKIISVILSLTMIMSAISVCFTSFAAEGSASNIAALMEALKNDYVKDATYTKSGNTVTFQDNADGSVQKAFDEYLLAFNSVAHFGSGNGSETEGNNAYRTTTQVADRIASLLQNADNVAFTAYNMGSRIAAFRAEINVTSTVDSNQKTATTAAVKIVPAVNLLTDTIDELPTSSVTKTYTFATEQKTYSKQTGSGCNATTTNYYYLVNKAVATNESTTTYDVQALKDLDAAIKANEAYFSYELADVLALLADEATAGEPVAAYNAISGALTAAKAGFSADVIAHFFGDYDVAGVAQLLDDAKNINAFIPVCSEINALIAVDYSAYTTDELVTLYTTLNTKLDAYEEATDLVKNYLSANSYIDAATAEAKLAEIFTAMQVAQLTDYKPTAEAVVEAAEAYNEDDVIAGTQTVAAVNAAIGSVSGVLAALATYEAANVNTVFGAGYTAELNALKSELERLVVVDGYNKALVEKYAAFIANIYSAVDVEAETAELIEKISALNEGAAEIDAFIAEAKATLGDDVAVKIYATAKADMDAKIAEIYAVIYAKTAAQIDVAYDLYENLEAFEGLEAASLVNLSTFNALNAAIGAIDTELYDFAKANGLDAEVVAKYDALNADGLLDDYNAFVASNGLDRFETTEIADIIREVSDKDVARNKDYTVTDENVEKIIALLDKVLGSTEIKGLGVDLGELIGQLPAMLYTDEIVNKLVGMLFPMITDLVIEMLTTMIPPTVDIPNDDNTSIPDIVKGKTVKIKLPALLTIAENAGLYLFPTQLVNSVKAEGFTDAANALAAAKTAPLFTAKKAVGTVKEQTLEDGTVIKVDSQGNRLDDNGVYVLDENGEYVDAKLDNPWYDSSLYRTVVDENGDAVLDEEGKEVKEFWLDWGIEGKDDFVNALASVLGFLEPVLASLLGNDFVKLQRNLSTTKQTIVIEKVAQIIVSINFNINTLHVSLKVGDAETGEGANLYNNVLVPIFELLGLDKADFADGKTFKPTLDKDGLGIASAGYATTKTMLNAILEPVEKILDNVAASPVDFVAKALPNLAYAVESGALMNLINAIAITLDVKLGTPADKSGAVDASGIGLGSLWGILGVEPKDLYEAFGLDMFIDGFTSPMILNIGELVDFNNLEINGTKLDLSSLNGLLGLVAGLLGVELPAMDGATLATLGTVVEKDTGRDKKAYNWGTDGKAAYIEANKADVLIFVLKYVVKALEDENFLNAIIAAFAEEPAEGEEAAPVEIPAIVNDIIANIAANTDDAIAAIAELIFPQDYDMPFGIDWKEPVDSETYATITDEEGKEHYIVTNELVKYSNIWTKDKAEYVAEHLPHFIDNVLMILGVLGVTDESLGGSLSEVITNLVAQLYTADTANKIVEAINGLVSGLELPEELMAIITDATGLDLGYWADLSYDFADGDRPAFKAAVVEILAPLTKALQLILAEEDIIVKLTDEETGKFDVVTLQGYDGYSFGLVPLLEALDADVMTTDAFIADKDNLVSNLVTMLLSAVDKIEAAPYDQVIAVLPNVLYFLASDGLAVASENLLFAVNVVLDTIRPIYDVNIYELVDFDLKFVEFDPISALFSMVASALTDAGLDFDISFNTEELFSMLSFEDRTAYTSANGYEAYKITMSTKSTADMLTVILRFVLGEFVYSENAAQYAKLAYQKLGISDEQFAILFSVLYAMKYLHEEAPDYTIAILYWIFFGADTAVDSTLGAISIADYNIEKVLANLEAAKTDAADKAAYVIAKVYKTLFTASKEVEKVLADLQKKYDDSMVKVDEEIAKIPVQVDATLNDIIADVRVTVKEVNDKINSTLDDITGSVDDTLGEITDKIEDGKDKAEDTLNGVADEINGVNDKMNSIFDKILKFFRDLMEKIKNIFKF